MLRFYCKAMSPAGSELLELKLALLRRWFKFSHADYSMPPCVRSGVKCDG